MVFIPYISTSSKTRLFRRKGGGGRGGGSSGGSRGGSSGDGSSGGSTGARSSVPISGSTGGRNSATAYGAGGGKVTTIPSGQLFAGRSEGGGTRTQVLGTRTYGSGYPGLTNQRGVSNLNFPFFFWPLVWGGLAFHGPSYLDDREYGEVNNSSRPGGSLMTATFASNSTNTTFHIISDNSTTSSLVTSITANCTSFLATNSSSNFTPQLFDTNSTNSPKPEQVIQYYRASSTVLTLDGYNNTAALSEDGNATDTALPSGIDTNLLDCLNQTIAAAVPLIDGATGFTASVQTMSTMGFFWIIWMFASML